MPHQCTNCGHQFADGSKEMLSGCPGCGGNKFQFRPSGADSAGLAGSAAGGASGTGAGGSDGAGAGGADDTGESGDADAAGRGVAYADRTGSSSDADSSTDNDDVTFAPETHPDPAADEPPPESASSTGEDGAQAQARSDVVSADELPPAPAPDQESQPESPDLASLREELNEQFESIRIVEPGQYELNLMGLYDREEYIIALEENGRYVINVPDSWQD